MDCIFCKIISKELDAKVRYEDDELLAFDDINPKAPTHILIIPKRHIATLNDIDDDETLLVGKLLQAAKYLAHQLGIAEPGYSIIMNCNQEGGQLVYHIHLHLLGGKQLHIP